MSREQDLLQKLEKDISLKELQIKSLLTITQAINENIGSDGLYKMYESFLGWEMGIEKMVLLIQNDDQIWEDVCNINVPDIDINGIMPELLVHRRLHTIKDDDEDILQNYDIIIPVFHKEEPIAYSLIGGVKDKIDLYTKIQFITTITNIIAVAIENKRLFKRQIKQERLNKELEVASKVQKMLIPDTLPKNEQYEIDAIYLPHSTIGGDYLDFIPFSDARFAVCIADISGKGVAAALLMANFQAIVQSLIYQYRDLETFVVALNEAVIRITKSDKYITFFIAEFDLNKKEMRYINAGHYPPLLKKGDQIIELKEGTNFIGAFDNLPHIKEGVVEIDEDSLLLCFTDGLAELKGDDDMFFDSEKISTFIEQNGSNNVKVFNELLMDEVRSFKGVDGYADDIAIITCKINV